MAPLVGFVGPTFQSLSPSADCEVCMDLYPEAIDGGATGKNKVVYYRKPGRKLFMTLPTVPLRCLLAGDGRLFAVSGSAVYEIAQNGTVVDHSGPGGAMSGAVTNDGYPGQIIPNGTQILVVSGKQAYLTNDGGATLSPLRFWDAGTDTPTGALIDAGMATILDGYYVAAIKDSKQFYVSDNQSGLGGAKWDPLVTANKESSPDNINALIESHGEVRFLGTQTGESWIDNGAPPPGVPFSRNPSGTIETGTIAPWSLAKLDDESLMWLSGNDRGAAMVVRATGYAPARVSTHAVEAAIQQYAVKYDAVAMTYQENGHNFYSLSFPAADATWVYDATSGLWHQRGHFVNGRYKADLARFHAYVFGKHLVGGGDGTGRIYEQSMELSDDAGTPIRWWRRSPHVNLEAKMMKHIKLQLMMQVGVADQNTDPQVTLRTSNDGGKTWGNERTVSAGKPGEYRKRVEWRQLGRSRDRVYEVYGTDPIPTLCLVDAYLDVQQGNGT